MENKTTNEKNNNNIEDAQKAENIKEEISEFNMLNFAKSLISVSQRKQEEKNLIILGDKASGKSTIMNNIIGTNNNKENYNPSSGISFNYLRQTIGQRKILLNLYEIGGGIDNIELIRTIINEDNYINTIFILCLDFNKPENVLKSFKNYIIELKRILKELFTQEILLEMIEKKKNNYVDRNVNCDYKRLTFFPADIYVIGNKYDCLEIREM
jgi:ATPase subunit of ABC transporter with duplicated ATPase domains